MYEDIILAKTDDYLFPSVKKFFKEHANTRFMSGMASTGNTFDHVDAVVPELPPAELDVKAEDVSMLEDIAAWGDPDLQDMARLFYDGQTTFILDHNRDPVKLALKKGASKFIAAFTGEDINARSDGNVEIMERAARLGFIITDAMASLYRTYVFISSFDLRIPTPAKHVAVTTFSGGRIWPYTMSYPFELFSAKAIGKIATNPFLHIILRAMFEGRALSGGAPAVYKALPSGCPSSKLAYFIDFVAASEYGPNLKGDPKRLTRFIQLATDPTDLLEFTNAYSTQPVDRNDGWLEYDRMSISAVDPGGITDFLKDIDLVYFFFTYKDMMRRYHQLQDPAEFYDTLAMIDERRYGRPLSPVHELFRCDKLEYSGFKVVQLRIPGVLADIRSCYIAPVLQWADGKVLR